jgi:hypothetical protein
MAKVHCRFVEFVMIVAGGLHFIKALREGVFRRSGEIHLCMYDRVRLAAALRQAKFTSIHSKSAGESDIPDFHDFSLEVSNSQQRKPDSLYIEARKPLGRA